MKLNEVEYNDIDPIDGYGPGFFRIGGKVHHGAVLTSGRGTQAWGGYDDLATLLALADHVDVIFLGTGADIAHAPTDLRQALEDAGIGVETMASPAAARTYNVLVSEGRRVAAALLAV